MIDSEKPLVTFALFAYNQEEYIREAVESVLAQDYTPLEIILSDDSSTDRTFETLSEIVKTYSGTAKVTLNRTGRNLGLAEHINQVMNIVNGELIVVAAGDDISFPNRVSENVRFYVENRKPDSIFSDYLDIDARGKEIIPRREEPPREQTIEDFLDNPRLKGAAHAWTKRLFDKFGPLRQDVLCEDQVIPFRAYLIGAPKFLDKKLIKYRRVEVNVAKVQFFRRHYARLLSSRLQYLADLDKIQLTQVDLPERIVAQICNINRQQGYWVDSKFSAIRHWWNVKMEVNFFESLSQLGRRLLS